MLPVGFNGMFFVTILCLSDGGGNRFVAIWDNAISSRRPVVESLC